MRLSEKISPEKLTEALQKSDKNSISKESSSEYFAPNSIYNLSTFENRLIIRDGPHSQKVKQAKSIEDSTPFGLRDNCKLSRLKAQISENENVLMFARKIGIEISSLELISKNIIASLDQGDINVAQDQNHLFNQQIRESFSEQFPRLARRIRKDIKTIEDFGRDGDIPKILVSKAKKAFKQERYLDAFSLLSASKKKLVDTHHEMVLDIINDARRSFILANRIGLSIEPSIALLQSSREMLRLGQINDAIRFAEESREIVDKKLNEYRTSLNLLTSCVHSFRVAHSMGIDMSDLSPMLIESRNLFRKNEYRNSLKNSEILLASTKNAIKERTSASILTAEKALELAKRSEIETSRAEGFLQKARDFEKNENHLRGFLSATSSLYESNLALLIELESKSRTIGELTTDISEEIENLSKTQEAILNSKERSLKKIREYSNIYETLITQAYDSSVSYTHVYKDILKQAVKKSVAKSIANSNLMIANDQDNHHGQYAIPEYMVESNFIGNKRLEIVQLYLNGKISGEELDRLLSEIDCNFAKAKLV